MHEDIPDYEPAEITPGETLEWTKEFDSFPASEWTLKYYFRGAGQGLDAVATADGETHIVLVPAASTASLVAGAIYWQAWVEQGAEKHLVESGQATVKPSLAALAEDATFDGRSDVKRILDAVDAMIAGKATRDQQEYQIGNRMLRRIPLADLINLRKHYAGLYAKERRRAGGLFIRNIETRFDEP